MASYLTYQAEIPQQSENKVLGEHQVMNALTALTALEVFRELGFKLTEEAIYKGF